MPPVNNVTRLLDAKKVKYTATRWARVRRPAPNLYSTTYRITLRSCPSGVTSRKPAFAKVAGEPM